MSSSDTLLEIYKLHAELTDRISQRRTLSNQFYIGILSAIFLLFPLMLNKELALQINVYKLILMASLLGIFICIIWLLNIGSLRRLNSEKFIVLQELEAQLPFMFYQKEWNLLTSKKHLAQSAVEKLIPLLFIGLFLIVLVYSSIKLLIP